MRAKREDTMSNVLATLDDTKAMGEIHEQIDRAWEALDTAHSLCRDRGDTATMQRINAAVEILGLIQNVIADNPEAARRIAARRQAWIDAKPCDEEIAVDLAVRR